MALSYKQQVFVDEYLACLNAAEAARRAGYSEKTARSIGAENLTKPDIAEEIKRRVAERAMPAEEVLDRLGRMARGDMSDFWDIPDDGKPVLSLSGERARDKLHLIRKLKVKTTSRMVGEIEVVTTEIEIEPYDAQAALVHIGKHHKLFTDKVEHDLSEGATETAAALIAAMKQGATNANS
jgi:phage terminase small subunit